VAREVADAIAAADDGRLPLVVGGDCTITLGVIAGFRRRHPDVGLVYVDGDSDVSVPGDGGSGILDAMGVSHLLGRGAPELTGLGGRRRCWTEHGWRSSAPTRGKPTMPGAATWPTTA
jgi:arginase